MSVSVTISPRIRLLVVKPMRLLANLLDVGLGT
jgi:hypothetical protein